MHASALLQHPQPRIRQLRNAVTAASSLQGLYPPAGFAKAAKDMNIIWTSVKLPTEATLQQALHTDIVKETELLHCPQDIIYTDCHVVNCSLDYSKAITASANLSTYFFFFTALAISELHN